ncbi:UDP-2,4-diacetamido-2,4,6-trideoxy-beta-L-altropyranose hydrolase [Propionivibrio sp.]|uniref:UDP-2,4-diacetamido-2,4, 6-trideoxy-beta-L-altropyranose hydrolase n=1 Tax=Propionivibrio sp. TaxID=2212460 RepID=UPI002628954D|nr:UDP-2,4-diacetamido-2,4,6-trideoxy-beta-L-altropyranose hydrolase [Propionivibrio sp.]
MNIAFRVDASTQIGIGHFMRCLTLADAFKKHGARTRFVSRYISDHLRSMLFTRDHEFRQFIEYKGGDALDGLPHSHWLGVSQTKDATDTVNSLTDQYWDWLIVDHYALDSRWEKELRPIARKILVIDDLADRHHDCDVLLDLNLYANMGTRYVGKIPVDCQLLLGPRYALLRDEFRQLRKQVKPRVGPVRRVLVSFGGVDAANYTIAVIDALAGIGIHDWHVDVVIGAQHPHREQIEEACNKHGFVLHVQTNQMAELMVAADLAIGAGGSAIWERCCLGLPSLSICAADNQSRQLADAASECLLYAPNLNGKLVHAIRRHVVALMENSHLRMAISRCGMQAVDGNGVLHVVGALGCSDILIRTAIPDDSEKLFEWRNNPDIRMASRSSDLISFIDHQKWFSSVLSDPSRQLLIGEQNGLPIGVVRFDVQYDEAEVSIYLNPAVRGLGLGRNLLRGAESWFLRDHHDINIFRADVLGTNKRSHRLFTESGYSVESTSYLKRF